MAGDTSIERAIASRVPGVRQSSNPADRELYARDLWPRHHFAVRSGEVAKHQPSLVVWPTSRDEVSEIVRVCSEEGIPIAPFGAGSGVCGGTLPSSRTVVVDLKRMDRLVSVDRETMTLDVEAGAMGIRLEEDLAAQGFTLGHFPSSILCSTAGGWIAARSAGQCSGLYGKIEDMIVDLDCVFGRGESAILRRRAHRPDVTPLIVGSEGVLGIVTSARLRVHPAPAGRSFAAFSFASLEHGTESMRELFQAGLRPAVCRLYDAFDSWMAKRGSVQKGHDETKEKLPKSGDDLKRSAKRFALKTVLGRPGLLNGLIDRIGDKAFGGVMLILVFEGDPREGAADVERARAIAARNGGEHLGEGPARHWLSHRYAVSYRQAPVFMSGAFSDTMEVASSWSRLPALYDGVRAALAPHVFVMAHLSHAYPDGCSIYFTFAGSASTREESEAKYDRAWRDALDAAIASGGTLSHHHGVGRSKAPRLGDELGLGVELVQALRKELDPSGILNPGNLLPERGGRSQVGAPAMPKEVLFDEPSLLAHAPATATLGSVEQAAAARGLSLRFADLDASETIASFLARGAPGAPDAFSDPVDHLVAGFTARLASGADLTVRPAPRRAVGPDLYALFHGMDGRVGELTSVFLRVHRNGLSPRPLPFPADRDPPANAAEQSIIDRVIRASRVVT